MPALLGYGYTERDGETRDWEQLRIQVIDGAPHLIAMPHGAAPVQFRLEESETPNRAAFVNPEHDFPQRIEYWREGNALGVRVSAGEQGFELHFRRIRCPANP